MSWLSNAVKSTPKPNAWNAGPVAGAASALGAGAFGVGAAHAAGADASTGGLLSGAGATYGAYNALGPKQQQWVKNGGVAGIGVPSYLAADAATGGALTATGLTGFGLGRSGVLGNGNGNGSNGSGSSSSTDKNWQSLYDEIANKQYNGAFENGVAKPGYGVKMAPWVADGPDSIADNYKQMIDEGKSSGLSNWGRAAYDRSRADQGYAVEDARQQSLADAGQGMNTLAMQGGLESGAAENMLRSSSRNAANARTNLYRQGSMDRMGIDVADASRKDDMRRQGLAGSMDVARYDTDVQNINATNAINDLQHRNEFDAGNLGMRGQMIGAKSVSDAMLAQANATSNQRGMVQQIADPFNLQAGLGNLWGKASSIGSNWKW